MEEGGRRVSSRVMQRDPSLALKVEGGHEPRNVAASGSWKSKKMYFPPRVSKRNTALSTP